MDIPSEDGALRLTLTHIGVELRVEFAPLDWECRISIATPPRSALSVYLQDYRIVYAQGSRCGYVQFHRKKGFFWVPEEGG